MKAALVIFAVFIASVYAVTTEYSFKTGAYTYAPGKIQVPATDTG